MNGRRIWSRTAARLLLAAALVLTFVVVFRTYYWTKDLYVAVASSPADGGASGIDWSAAARRQLWEQGTQMLWLWSGLVAVWFASGLVLGRGVLAPVPQPAAGAGTDPS